MGVWDHLKQYVVDKIEKQFGGAKPEEMVTGFHKQCSSNHMRFIMAVYTHPSYNTLQLCSHQQQHLQINQKYYYILIKHTRYILATYLHWKTKKIRYLSSLMTIIGKTCMSFDHLSDCSHNLLFQIRVLE